MKRIISYILLIATIATFMPYSALAENTSTVTTDNTTIEVETTISTNIKVDLTTGKVTPADMTLKNNSSVAVDVKITNIAPSSTTTGPNTFVGANDKNWKKLTYEETKKYLNFNIKPKGTTETPKDILANTNLDLGTLYKKDNTDSTKTYEVSANFGTVWDAGEHLLMYQITLVFSQSDENDGLEDYVCVPASGDDLTYAYQEEFYEPITGQNTYKHVIGNYTTGNKQVGDAYKCTVGDGISYVFNILVNRDETVSLIMSKNIDTQTVGWCDNESTCKIDGMWTNQKGPLTANNSLITKTSAWTNKNILSISLPSYDDIYSVNANQKLSTTPWLYGNLDKEPNTPWVLGYWTSSYKYVDEAVYVGFDGVIWTSYVEDNSNYGIRPVITISKNSIK